MSGHNRWSQIKHKKDIVDAKKAKLFGKLSKAIVATARENPDPKTNLKLQSAIDNARAQDMPNENIDRLLKRASEKADAVLEELVLEALGPGGIALIITAITDSRNRTLNEIKILLGKYGAKMVGANSLAWMFSKRRDTDGSLVYEATTPMTVPESDQKQLEDLYNALDDNDDVQEVFSNEQAADNPGN